MFLVINKNYTFAPNLQTQKYSFYMSISIRPIRFILSALIACLPLFTFANIVQDSTHTTTHVAQTNQIVSEAVVEKTEPTLSKEELAVEERAEFIQHHLLDSHDFHLFSYGKYCRGKFAFYYSNQFISKCSYTRCIFYA